MYSTRRWLQALLRVGFTLRRTRGGHARYALGTVNIDVPIHQRELSPNVVASLRRALRAVGKWGVQ